MCQGPHQQGFRHSGNTLDERMGAGKNGNQGLIHHVLITDDDLGDFLFGFHQNLSQNFRIFIHRVFPLK